MELSFSSIVIFWTFALIFLFCVNGERISEQFESLGEEVEQCDWHLLPVNMQRMYLIFLSITQQPIHIRSYAGFICSRDTFKQVLDPDIQITMRMQIMTNNYSLFFTDNQQSIFLFHDTLSIWNVDQPI